MSPYTLKTLEFGPRTLSRIVDRIDPARWDHVTEPGRFTLREAIAHLADWEPIFRERFELVRAQPGATIVVYDEGQFAIDRDYAHSDLRATLDRFAAERAVTAELVRSMTPEDYRKPLVHPEAGNLVLEDVITMLIGHDLYHIEHATELL